MSERNIDLDTRGSRPAFFKDPDVDTLMTALLETMSQLWATRDYAHALEKCLVEKGVLQSGELDSVRWSPQEQAANHAARAAFLADAFRAVGADFQSARKRTDDIDSGQSMADL